MPASSSPPARPLVLIHVSRETKGTRPRPAHLTTRTHVRQQGERGQAQAPPEPDAPRETHKVSPSHERD